MLRRWNWRNDKRWIRGRCVLFASERIWLWWRSETDEEKILAILHDVVEDTDWTFEALREEEFTETIIEALKTVTKHSDDEDYDEFIQRSLKNKIGRKVKIADLRENLDVTRIGELTDKDIERINKYKRALKTLTEC